jgi:flagellar motor component MotA
MGEKMNQKDFTQKYNAIVERALFMSNKARREGLLSLEEELDSEKYLQRELFEYGMRLVVDGTDAPFIDRILTNIINLEQDNDVKTLKTIQKEAVLSIQAGDNPRIMALLLNSYVNIGIEEAMKRFIE